MNVRCPECRTLYRIDPDRVPGAGIRARCSQCGNSFLVRNPAPSSMAKPVPADPSITGPASSAGPADVAGSAGPAAPAAPTEEERAAASPVESSPAIFARPDPADRAQRLARALVSDIVAYHGERVEASYTAGTLREDLRDEILKSWEEYVLQVGQRTADETPYFRDALNEILARGQVIF